MRRGWVAGRPLWPGIGGGAGALAVVSFHVKPVDWASGQGELAAGGLARLQGGLGNCRLEGYALALARVRAVVSGSL